MHLVGRIRVNYYNVYRKYKEDSSFPDHVFAKVEMNEFVDTLSEEGVYDYAVQVVIDSIRSSTLSSPIRIERMLEKPLPPLKIRLYSANGSTLLIQWDNSATTMKAYNVYRSTGNGTPELLKTVPGNQLECMDNGIKKGDMYYYSVSSVDSSSIESERSQEVFYTE